MTCTRAVWKDFQTLFRTRAGGPTLYEGRARARARAKYPEIFMRFCPLPHIFNFSCTFPAPKAPQSLRPPIW